jgi:predicted Zn-dependent peptidase
MVWPDSAFFILSARPACRTGTDRTKGLKVEKEVPFDAIYFAFQSTARMDPDYYAADLMTDILSRGRSSRMYNVLVKEKKLFSEINAYCTGDRDKGLVIVDGKLVKEWLSATLKKPSGTDWKN